MAQDAAVRAGLLDGVLSAARALEDTGESWRLADREVEAALAAVGRARQLLEVAEVTLVREGVGRGLPAESSWSPVDWVARCEGGSAPAPDVRHSARVVRVAEAGDASLAGSAVGEPPAAAVVAAFEAGDLPLAKADQLVRFHTAVAPVADPEALEHDLAALLHGARDEVRPAGPDGRADERVRGLTEKELGAAITFAGRMLRPSKELEDEERAARAGRTFTKSEGPAGLSTYRVTLDSEGAAVVDAAIATRSGPVTGPDGRRDERAATRRRADALVELLRQATAAPGDRPSGDKAQVIVTVDLQTLLDGLRGGGLTATGQVLSPAVVRRMACNSSIIPAVLGTRGEILDLGRAARWFTAAQKRAIWLRDKGCTFPGCTRPPQWCDAHHVRWWSRGGGSDISNGALLCESHHTYVHTHDLTATITATHVTWHV